MSLRNTTTVDNDFGVALINGSLTEFQNAIFKNDNSSLQTEGFSTITSKGANICGDTSMAAFSTGYDVDIDQHTTDPIRGADFVPNKGSSCIDAGNPEGVVSDFNL